MTRAIRISCSLYRVLLFSYPRVERAARLGDVGRNLLPVFLKAIDQTTGQMLASRWSDTSMHKN